MNHDEIEAIHARLDALRLEHADLDDVISHLTGLPHYDQLRLQRLKKRKLLLKDMIAKFESMLIPDMPA